MNETQHEPNPTDGAEPLPVSERLFFPEISWCLYDQPTDPCGMILIPADCGALWFKGIYHELRPGFALPRGALESAPVPIPETAQCSQVAVFPEAMVVPLSGEQHPQQLALFIRKGEEVIAIPEGWLEKDGEPQSKQPNERVGCVLMRTTEPPEIQARFMRELAWRIVAALLARICAGHSEEMKGSAFETHLVELTPLPLVLRTCDDLLDNPATFGFVKGIEAPLRASCRVIREFCGRALNQEQRVFVARCA